MAHSSRPVAGTSDLPIFRFMRSIRPCAGTRAGKGAADAGADALGPGIYCSIMVLNSVMERAGNRTLEEHNLTIPQWLGLGAVLNCGDTGISHGQLGQRMMLSKAPVTGLVDRLVRAGLVERRPDEHDRRVSRVVITLAGETLWHQAHETLMDDSREDMLGCLAQDEQEQLLRLMSQLLSSFSSQDPHVAELVAGHAEPEDAEPEK